MFNMRLTFAKSFYKNLKQFVLQRSAIKGEMFDGTDLYKQIIQHKLLPVQN